jgi:hypothetical protein
MIWKLLLKAIHSKTKNYEKLNNLKEITLFVRDEKKFEVKGRSSTLEYLFGKEKKKKIMEFFLKYPGNLF